jgi:FkbM family methyltransferase|tara:strand:- start:1238 stop:2065 length:828 start_codon:yes stop_codon:yes gene_type:complete
MKKILKLILPQFLKSFILNIVWKSKGRKFCFFYNLISRFLFNSKNKIIYDDKKYILNEHNFKWSFSYEKRGLWYMNGIKERGKKLHRDYGVDGIEFNKDDVIIDVGADVGDFKNGFDKEIDYHAFEADPSLFDALTFNCSEKNCYNVGIWENETKEIIFYINKKNKKKSITKVPGDVDEIKIKTTTLDNFIKKIDKKIKLIKIDTTGSEPEALYGLSKFLSKIEYIVVDACAERGVMQKNTISECLNYMYKNNFHVVNFKLARSCILFHNKSKIS